MYYFCKIIIIVLIPLGLLTACSQETRVADAVNEAPAAQEVAQTELMSHPPPHPDQDLINRAGAPLFDGMGSHDHEITTSEPGAQRYFDQGLVLAFAFNHAEAIRSFKAAQKLDPSCAMCYWGEALATGPNINVTSNGKVIMSPDERLDAFDALQLAIARKANASVREQAYIDALQHRYNGDVTKDREGLDQAYAKAMGRLAEKYPEDMDAAVLYAESLMNTMPWNYWKDDGDPREDTQIVISALEKVLAAQPRHPLAIHLYIHAVEASSTPGRAESAADRLAELVPGAGHLVHMPSHIYWRVGRYHDASDANIAAANVDEAYIAQCNAQGFYPALYYPHNIHFLWAASTMEGRSQLSIESAIRVADNVNVEQVKQFPTIEFFRTIPQLSYVRFGKWDQILAMPEPAEEFRYSHGIHHYARGIAHAAKGDLDAAKMELQQLEPLKDSVSVRFLDTHDFPASKLLDIANELLLGEIQFAMKNYAEATDHYETAVRTQDTLPYTEPPFWYYPARQSLGHSLLMQGKSEAAEAVYRQDLKNYPRNGWSMFGLVQALEEQQKTDEAAEVRGQFKEVWQMSDIELSASRI
ncbi:MAG: tetratricopeptide repeat protein [Gammaproteobacteria bacterium]|nr:tetratricopeptide repeat protein [Gammaproteobacteria bacterium]